MRQTLEDEQSKRMEEAARMRKQLELKQVRSVLLQNVSHGPCTFPCHTPVMPSAGQGHSTRRCACGREHAVLPIWWYQT